MRGHVSSLVNCSYIYLKVKNKGGLCLVWREEGEVEVYVLLEKAEPSSAFPETWEAEKERRSKTSFFFLCKCLFFFLFSIILCHLEDNR